MSAEESQTGEALSSAVSDARVSYLVVYKTQTAEPAAADLGALAGLAAWHFVVDPTGTRRLMTYWKSSDHYKRDGATLTNKLGVQGGELGYVGQIRQKAQPLWKKIRMSTAILSLAALLGAVEVITNRYDRLFAEPSLLIKPERSRVSIIEGDDFATNVQIGNQVSTEHSHVKVAAALRADGGGRSELQLSTHEIPELVGNGAKDVMVSGVAPGEGKYKLEVAAEGGAGLVRARKEFQGVVDVTVWPREPSGTVTEGKTKQVGRIAGRIAIGRAADKGLDCTLEIDSIPGLRFDGAFSMPVEHSQPVWKSAGSGAAHVDTLWWAVGAIAMGSQYLPVDIVLVGSEGTSWSSVIAHSKLQCQYRTEAFRHEQANGA